MHALFDCDNCNTLRQDALKKIKAVDNIELNTSIKLQKLKILLSDGSLKSFDTLGKYMTGIFETRTRKGKGELVLNIYL